jgi:hypothetical protein
MARGGCLTLGLFSVVLFGGRDGHFSGEDGTDQKQGIWDVEECRLWLKMWKGGERLRLFFLNLLKLVGIRDA